MIILLFFAANFAAQYGYNKNYSPHDRKGKIQQCRQACQSEYAYKKTQLPVNNKNVGEAGANYEADVKKSRQAKLDLLEQEYEECKKNCTKFLKNLKDGVMTKLGDKTEQLVDVQIDDALESLFDVVGAGIRKAAGVVKYLSTGTDDFPNKAKTHAVVLKSQVDITIEYKGFEAKHGKQFGLKNFSKKDSFTEETINTGETLAVRFANSSWSPAGVSGTAIYQYYDDKDINKMLLVDIEHIAGDGTKCCAYTINYVSQWREEASQTRNCSNDQRKWIDHSGTSVEILKDNKTSEFSTEARGSTECVPGVECKRIRYCTINFFKTEQTAAGSVKITIPDEDVTKFFIHGNENEDVNQQAQFQQDKKGPAPNQQMPRNFNQRQSSYKPRNAFQARRNSSDESEDDYGQDIYAQFFKNQQHQGNSDW